MNLIKFEDTELKVQYINNEIQMTIEELAKALGCAEATIRSMFTRNSELNNSEFSILREFTQIENGVVKKREKRIFTEQGIYEVTLLAKTKRAAEFRKFVRNMLTKLRKNELVVNQALSPLAHQKLDEMIDIIAKRDEQLEDLIEYLSKVRDRIDRIEVLEENQKIIIKQIDKMGEAINQLIDRVYEEEEIEETEEE